MLLLLSESRFVTTRVVAERLQAVWEESCATLPTASAGASSVSAEDEDSTGQQAACLPFWGPLPLDCYLHSYLLRRQEIPVRKMGGCRPVQKATTQRLVVSYCPAMAFAPIRTTAIISAQLASVAVQLVPNTSRTIFLLISVTKP